MPWNPIYKSAWQTFLMTLNARYGTNPVFVSIAIAGPTAASAEMLVPNDSNSNNPQTQFGASITPSHMWLQLLALEYAGSPAYQDSDEAFIAEWENAIDTFGQVFSGVTLVATTGDGLPNFAGAAFTIPSAYTAYCNTPNMDCAAETTILSYFAQASVGGANAKATQTSGMEASRGADDLGVQGVKQLSASTAQFTSPSSQILGGAQFNTTFSTDTLGRRVHRHVSAQCQRYARGLHYSGHVQHQWVPSGRVHPHIMPRPWRYLGESGNLRNLLQGPFQSTDPARAG